jgi:hypothetical protein
MAMLLIPCLMPESSRAGVFQQNAAFQAPHGNVFSEQAVMPAGSNFWHSSELNVVSSRREVVLLEELKTSRAGAAAHIAVPNPGNFFSWGHGPLGVTPEDESFIPPAAGAPENEPTRKPSLKTVQDLAKKGFEAVERRDFQAADILFQQAARDYLLVLRIIHQGDFVKHLHWQDFELWTEYTQTKNAFAWDRLKNLDMRIRQAGEFEQMLLASLRLVSNYWRFSGPDISAVPVQKAGVIANPKELQPDGFQRWERVKHKAQQVTASDTYEAVYQPTEEIYIIKRLDRERSFIEVLGHLWMERLGFSVVDTHVIDIGGHPAVVMKKIPNVVTLFDYMKTHLFDPYLFNGQTLEMQLLPDSFRELLEGSKLAGVVIELKDAQLRNVLLQVDAEMHLQAYPPLMIDHERSFGFRTNPRMGEGLAFQPYRGRFTQKELESGKETNPIAGEPMWQRDLPLARMEKTARTILQVTEQDVDRMLAAAYGEMGIFAPQAGHFAPQVIRRKFLEALGSVRTIFGPRANASLAMALPGIFISTPASLAIVGALMLAGIYKDKIVSSAGFQKLSKTAWLGAALFLFLKGVPDLSWLRRSNAIARISRRLNPGYFDKNVSPLSQLPKMAA